MGLLTGQKRKKWQKLTLGRLETKEDVLLRQQKFSNSIARGGIAIGITLILTGLVTEGWFRTYPFDQAAAFAFLVFLASVIAWVGLTRFFPQALSTVASFHRLVGIVLGYALLAKGIFLLLDERSVFFAPLPLLAMTATVMYSQYVAAYLVAGCALLTGFMSPEVIAPGSAAAAAIAGAREGVGPSIFPVPVIDLTLSLSLLLGGLVAVLTTGRMRSQSRPLAVGFFAGLTAAVVIAMCDIIGMTGASADRYLRPLCGLANGILCGVVMTSVLPVMERLLDILTEHRLRELADLSSELLRTFALRAPGSVTHSQNVAHLASEAAAAIGADPLLARVGAYYHDIGKVYKPEYFVENATGGPNPHDRLSPEMSRLVIVSHVKDGLGIAEEERLPPKIAAMIPMHHGTCVVTYFYRKAKDQADAGSRHDIDMETYRYPGPKPTFKEAAILMLADAVEAASRTVSEPTAPRLKDLVHELVFKRLLEGELDDSELTMRDLGKIEESFLRTLSTQIFHGRIPYPKDETPSSPARYADLHNHKAGVGADKASADS
jgi:putative nucleotidyltransferase with HDIG domain